MSQFFKMLAMKVAAKIAWKALAIKAGKRLAGAASEYLAKLAK